MSEALTVELFMEDGAHEKLSCAIGGARRPWRKE